MKQLRIPAAFMRGGTSKAIVFHGRDLPDRSLWDSIFLNAMGSPDNYARQLNGMGGGSSSLSKVCVVSPTTHRDADVDFTYAQVRVQDAKVDYSANCGNMSAAIGPFAVDEGLIRISDSEALVRIHNTNTNKIVHARFAMDDGFAAVDGNLEIPGVSGRGAPVRLEFLEPGGATTGRLLPTGNVVDTLDVPGVGKVRASLVDAANATCFLSAGDLGLTGTEMPNAVDGAGELLNKLEKIRLAASIAMGIARSTEEAMRKHSVPFVGFVSAPQDSNTLSGTLISRNAIDLTGRIVAHGQLHRALPLTVSLCMAVAARIEGTLVNQAVRLNPDPDAEIRIAMPSGVLTVAAKVKHIDGAWHAEQGAFFRTQRRLFDGHVYIVPSTLNEPLRAGA